MMAIKQSRLQTVLCENTQGGTSASSYNENNLIKLPKCKTQHDYSLLTEHGRNTVLQQTLARQGPISVDE